MYIYNLVCWTPPLFLTSWNLYDFCDWFQKKWVLFKIQEGKPLASKSLGHFPIELCSKHIQWGFQCHSRQFVKHERGYRWGRSGDFIVKLKKKYTFLSFYVRINEFRMGGYFMKICFLNRQFKKSSQGTVLNFHGNRHRVTPDIWPT